MNIIRFVTTAYRGPCEYVELDSELNVLVRKTLEGIENASSIIATDEDIVVAEESSCGGKIHFLNTKLELVRSLETGIKGIVYLDYQRDNNCIWGASYSTGEIFLLKNGKIKKYKDGGERSQIHCVKSINNYVYSVNCGENKICCYNNLGDRIVYNNEFAFVEGVKPRHLLEVDGYFYVICENSNEIYILHAGINGELMFLDKTTTLLEDNIRSYASTMYMKDNVIYSLNRGKNTISIFEIFENHKIKLIKEIPTLGDYPWEITGTNNGYLLVSNQRSGEITIFKVIDKFNIKHEKTLNKFGVNNIFVL